MNLTSTSSKFLIPLYQMLKKSRSLLVKLDRTEQYYLDTLSKIYPKVLMTNNEIIENIKNYRSSKNPEILNKLIYNFIKLLIKSARKYKRREIDIGDLIHYGVDGLIESISYSFKIESKNKFITYITTVVERRMKDGLDDHKNVTKFPKHIIVEQRKARCSPVIDKKSGKSVLLYSKFNIGHYTEFSSIIAVNSPNEFAESVEGKLDKESLVYDINRIFKNLLTTIEVEIITVYFGLESGIGQPYEAISNNLEIPMNEVKEIMSEALLKLKQNKSSNAILQKYLT